MTKILMATDGSPHSEKVTNTVIKLARALDADVSVISVAEVSAGMGPDLVALYRESMEKEVKNILNRTKEHFAGEGLTVETIFKEGHPSDLICAVADEGNYDMIVLGNRGLGKIKEMILGSVSNRVAHCAKKSVYIVK